MAGRSGIPIRARQEGRPRRRVASTLRLPLDFFYKERFEELPEAYQTLLLDVIDGDQTLFVHADEVEAAWKLFTPILDNTLAVSFYAAGSWGPKEADELLQRNGQKWTNEPRRE